MELEQQIKFRENEKYFNYLKNNSYYFKELNRGNITYEQFVKDMKIKYKERTSDKISSFIDNIDIVSSIIDTLK